MFQKEVIKDRARSALLGVFPTKEAFRNFKESDLKFAPESISKFFDFAEINSLMTTSSAA